MFFHYDFYILHLIFSIITSAGKIAIYHYFAYFAGAGKIATALFYTGVWVIIHVRL